MSEIIYVLTNEAMPGLVKIGLTTESVESRIAQLSTHWCSSSVRVLFCRGGEGLRQIGKNSTPIVFRKPSKPKARVL